jgi:hypothetical protein
LQHRTHPSAARPSGKRKEKCLKNPEAKVSDSCWKLHKGLEALYQLEFHPAKLEALDRASGQAGQEMR